MAVMERLWCSLQGNTSQVLSELKAFKFNILWVRRGLQALLQTGDSRQNLHCVPSSETEERHGNGNVQLRERKA